MPQSFILTDPDGNQFNMNVPDGATQEQIQAKVDEFKANHAQAAQRNAFGQSIETSPTEGVEADPRRGYRENFQLRHGFTPPGSEKPSQENPHRNTMLNNAAEKGVDIHGGLGADLRAQANLMDLNPHATEAALEYLVSERLSEMGIELPDGVPAVFKDESTGELAYWKPTQDGKLRPTLVNPVGLDAGDMIIAGDETVQIGAEVIAGFGGAAVGAGSTGNPFGAAAGGALSVGATNAAVNKARIELARAFGMPDEVIDKIESDDMLYEALLAGGFELAGPAAVGAFRGLRNKYASGGLDPNDLEAMKAEIAKIKALSDEIYEDSGVRITPTLGGATGNEALLVAEANTARDALGKHSRIIKEDVIRNRAATGNAIRAINDNAVQTMPRVDSTTLGADAKDVLAQPRRTADELTAQAEKGQLEQSEEANALWSRDRYAGIQKDLESASALAAESETIAWDNFRKQIELDPETKVSNIVLRNSGDQPIPRALSGINQESQQALSNSLEQSQKQLVEDLGWKPDPETGLIPRQNLADATLDANQLHVLLSHLKHQARREDAGSGLGWRGQDIHTMIGAIEEQMANGSWARRTSGRMVNPTKAEYISASWELANGATRAKHEMFNTKAVREVFRTNSDGEFLAQPGTVRGLIFKPGNAESLNDVLRVVGNNPVKRAGMIDELNTLYRENVFNEGKFSKGQHDAFVSQYHDHIRLLTGEDQSDFISNAADFNRVVERAQQRSDKIQDMMSNAYGRRLSGDDLYAGNVADDMLSDALSTKQINTIKHRLNREAPELWEEVKAHGLQAIEQRLLKTGGNEANSAQLTKLLADHGPRIGEIYGPKYLRNLQNMETMLSAMERGKLARGSKGSLNPPWLQVMRSVFGPLSPIQRRVTAATRFINGRRKARMQKLIADPDQLDKLVEWQRMSPQGLRYMQAGFALFGASFRESLDEEQLQTLQRVEELRGKNTRAVAAVNDRRGRDPSTHR
jgi:hypothetical protein